MKTSNPDLETRKIKDMLTVLIDSARAATRRVDCPKAQALLETTAETLGGLRTAYEHYENEAEPAMTEPH